VSLSALGHAVSTLLFIFSCYFTCMETRFGFSLLGVLWCL